MNCPNCGAAMTLDPGRTHFRCGYCETVHVPETDESGLIELGADHGLSCPRCKVRLKKGALDGGSVASCARCRGILFPADHFAGVVARRRAARSDSDVLPAPFDREELRRSTSCPRCGRRMDTHPYGGGGAAVIDSCPRCALVWLDAGELAVLARHAPRRPD